jgi:hypothetical protein
VNSGVRAPVNLYRPKYATTTVLTWLTPNPTPSDPNPSINCMNPAQNSSTYDDGGTRGKTEEFNQSDLQAIGDLRDARTPSRET